MVMNRLEGIIYKTQPYKESSRLLQVFTPLGKVSLNARGSQRINSNDRVIAQYLNLIEFEYNTFKSFMTLSKAKLINDFNNIKTNFNLAKTASLVLELIDKVMIDEIYCKKVYELIIATLNSKYLEISVLSFALKMLYYLGYGMNLLTEEKMVIGVSIDKGGLVYKGENFRLDLNVEEAITLLKLTHLKIGDKLDIDESHLNEIKRFIYYYYENKMDVRLKALK